MSILAFDYSVDVATIDFREHPERYRVGRGEQGVLLVESYKSELLPHWRFRTPEVTRVSADHIFNQFLAFKAAQDFVRMDMARQFLQMGVTRARRYANHASERKYDRVTGAVLPQVPDWAANEKAQAARIFYAYYARAEADPDHQRAKRRHQQEFG